MTARPVEEIQRAHDLILPIILGEVPNPVTDEIEKPVEDPTPLMLALRKEDPKTYSLVIQLLMRANVDVLCWVLRHDHNETFEKNLARMEGYLRGRGIILEDKGN